MVRLMKLGLWAKVRVRDDFYDLDHGSSNIVRSTEIARVYRTQLHRNDEDECSATKKSNVAGSACVCLCTSLSWCRCVGEILSPSVSRERGHIPPRLLPRRSGRVYRTTSHLLHPVLLPTGNFFV